MVNPPQKPVPATLTHSGPPPGKVTQPLTRPSSSEPRVLITRVAIGSRHRPARAMRASDWNRAAAPSPPASATNGARSRSRRAQLQSQARPVPPGSDPPPASTSSPAPRSAAKDSTTAEYP